MSNKNSMKIFEEQLEKEFPPETKKEYQNDMSSVKKEFNKSKSASSIKNSNRQKILSLRSEIVLASEFKSHGESIRFEKVLPKSTNGKDADIYLQDKNVYIEIITPKSKVNPDNGEVWSEKLESRYFSNTIINKKIKTEVEDIKYFVAIDLCAVEDDLKLKMEMLADGSLAKSFSKSNVLDGIILYDSQMRGWSLGTGEIPFRILSHQMSSAVKIVANILNMNSVKVPSNHSDYWNSKWSNGVSFGCKLY